MTEEQETQRLLRAGWAQIPAGVAPVSDLIRAGKRAKRQRRGLQVTGVAAATALVVAGGFVLNMQVGIGPSPQTPAATPPSEPAAEVPSSAGSANQSSSPSQPPATHGGTARTVVPVLVGFAEEEALERVDRWGLKADVHGEPAPCVPEGTVVYQDPRAGSRAPKGSTVVLAVAGRSAMHPQCEEGVATADDRDSAAIFYRFSRAPKTSPAFGDLPITLGIADVIKKDIPAARTKDATAWRMQPPASSGVSGPLNPLEFVSETEGRYSVYSGPYPPDCVGQPLNAPVEFRGLRQLSIQPRLQGRAASCLKWWSVSLFVNDVRQVNGVTLDFWEP